MAAIKISSKVKKTVWENLKQLLLESHQSISNLLTEAISEYMQLRRIRPKALEHLKESVKENKKPGRRLAK